MATRKTFLYYEAEVSQELRDMHNTHDHVGYVIQQVLDTMISETDNKYAKILKEIVYSCTSHYAYKEGTNIGAICIEFINERDYDRRTAVHSEVNDYLVDAGITISNETVRHMDFTGMQQPGPDDDANSYWKTKVYFHDTLPAARGFSTDCMLEEAADDASWIDHWTREL